ncbi:MAG: hypothetical protein KJZ87_16025 [Thermoguttaceae bacterium]|nr:hypothetical protein [Thermoguttaceae bacterium]
MAENEYLDSRKARRWLAVAEAVRNRRSAGEIGKLVLDRFRKTLRSIAKDMPLEEWMAAVDDPTELERAFDAVDGAVDVKDLLLQAAAKGGDPEQVVERFLNQALENCLYDIPYIAADLDGNVNLSEARRTLNEARGSISPEIQRMAKKFADNPAWLPRSPSDKSDAPKEDQTVKMLGESLMAGFRQ